MVIPVRYRTEMADARTLRAADWSRAALAVIAVGGVDRITVEGLARQLGVTKGSCYWHFADRAALISGALEMWEREATLDVIEELRRIPDPALRLRTLFETSFGDTEHGPIDVALVTRVDDPIVGPVVSRVTAKRIAFLEEVYRELGLTAGRAAGQARITYCTYVGHFQVRRSLPDDGLLAEPTSAYLRQLLETVTAR